MISIKDRFSQTFNLQGDSSKKKVISLGLTKISFFVLLKLNFTIKNIIANKDNQTRTGQTANNLKHLTTIPPTLLQFC